MEAPPRVTERIAAELLAPVRRETGRGSLFGPNNNDAAVAGKDPFASLPVLGAVRQFIDNERRRTRRMIINLVLVFAVVLMSFVAAFVYIAEVQMRRVKSDLEAGQKTIAAAAAQIGVLKNDIAEEAQKLNRQLADGGQQAASALAAVQTLDASITNAVSQLGALKANNADVVNLKSQSMKALSDMDSKWNSLNDRLDELAQQNFFLRARLSGKAGGQLSAPILAAPGREGIFLDLSPSNSGSRINWRLPMP